jgi:hypothetical protein
VRVRQFLAASELVDGVPASHALPLRSRNQHSLLCSNSTVSADDPGRRAVPVTTLGGRGTQPDPKQLTSPSPINALCTVQRLRLQARTQLGPGQLISVAAVQWCSVCLKSRVFPKEPLPSWCRGALFERCSYESVQGLCLFAGLMAVPFARVISLNWWFAPFDCATPGF